MAKLSAIKADMRKVEEGRWETYSAGIQLRIASTSSIAYRRARNDILKPYMRGTRSRAIDPDRVIELLKPAVARYLLLDWRNIEDDNGKAIKYSPEKAMEFFDDPALKDFYEFVLEVAGETDLYRQQAVADEAKNSKTA